MIKHWHMWIEGRLYTMYCVDDKIHYEGNGHTLLLLIHQEKVNINTMDFLTTEPVIDFLGEQINAYEEDWKCVACGHALTLHTAGMRVHDRCLLVGCGCQRAVLTESAIRKMKHGTMP